MRGLLRFLNRQKKSIGYGIFLLILIETSSFVFIELYFFPRYSRFFHHDFEDYIDRIPDSWVEAFRYDAASIYSFDPLLGWDVGPNKDGINTTGCNGTSWHFSSDDLGSRTNPHPSVRPLISLYGGSYTFSAEVNDDETWQYYLSRLTDSKVYNFGVGGHGPDQALLKLKRNTANNIRTPIVIIGLYSAGIHRTVTAFVPFRTLGEGLKLGFKPMLRRLNGEFEWIPTPLKSLDDRSAFHRAFEAAKEYDYWFAQNQIKPHADFPYSLTMLETAYYILAVYFPNRNLWINEDVAAADNVREIVRRFVELGKQEDFLPVVVFLPELGELDRYSRGGESHYREFRASLEESYPESELVVIDVLEEEFDASRFSLPGCHPSVYGNRVIAETVFKRIAPIVEELRQD